MIVKALTISQPWADLIIDRKKFVENRCWRTHYRGYFAIHAGVGSSYLTKKELAKYTTGAVLGYARLTDCFDVVEIHDMALSKVGRNLAGMTKYTWQQIAEHEHTEGEFCYVLEDVVKFETPVPMKGLQRFWNCELPDSLNLFY